MYLYIFYKLTFFYRIHTYRAIHTYFSNKTVYNIFDFLYIIETQFSREIVMFFFLIIVDRVFKLQITQFCDV